VIKVIAVNNEMGETCCLFDDEELVEFVIDYSFGVRDIYIYGHIFKEGDIEPYASELVFTIDRSHPQVYELFDLAYKAIVTESATAYLGDQLYEEENEQLRISSEDVPNGKGNQLTIKKRNDSFELVITQKKEEGLNKITFYGPGGGSIHIFLFETFGFLLSELSKIADQDVKEFDYQNFLRKKSGGKQKEKADDLKTR
jgi:hypothetical protein